MSIVKIRKSKTVGFINEQNNTTKHDNYQFQEKTIKQETMSLFLINRVFK